MSGSPDVMPLYTVDLDQTVLTVEGKDKNEKKSMSRQEVKM